MALTFGQPSSFDVNGPPVTALGLQDDVAARRSLANDVGNSRYVTFQRFTAQLCRG